MTTSAKSLKKTEVWNATASAFDSTVNQNKTFSENVEWSVDDPTILSVTPSGSHNVTATVTALKVGTTILRAVSEGVTHECTVTVDPLFDEINLAWSKIS